MSADDDKTPTGRDGPDSARLTYRTKFRSVDDLVQRLAPAVYDWGLLLRDSADYQNGDHVQFALLLGDGRPAVQAKGEVRRSAKLPKGRMALKFLDLDASSQAVWDRMLDVKKAAKAAAAGVPVAEEQPSAFSALPADQEQPSAFSALPAVQQQPGEAGAPASHEQKEEQKEKDVLDDSLRRMILIDGDADVGEAARPAPAGTKKEGLIIGIDLGTTNCCCAMVKGERPFVIPSRRGHNTIPSVVAINEVGDELVGSAAKAQMEINPQRTIYGSKRLIGRPFDSPVVQQMRDRFHYQIVEGKNNEAAVLIDDRIMSLEEVAALILTEIRDTAQEYLGQIIERAVITVPAFYNENQRQAVRKAGELAGFQVERILNEPTAAALTFGVKSEGDRRLLVYDLGGGTFDASVLDLKGDVYEVLSTGGDTFLGGVDFDTQLMDHILIEFQLNLGKIPDMDRVAYLRVLQGAEFAKRSLSSKSEADVHLPFIGKLDGEPVDLDVKVTREQLETLVTPLVQRTLDVCESVLAQRSLKSEDIDDILLVGGQTRMPLIWQKIHELFGKEPLKGVHPDESVATGAALMGHSITRKADFKLIDVLPISIGVGVPGGMFRKVITAGTALPAARTYGLYTYVDNQSEMIIPVYQGESIEIDEGELLGTVELTGIPPGPAGSRMIEVTFALSPECLLSVTARDHDGGRLADVHFNAQDSLESMAAKLASVPKKAAAAAAAVEKPEEPPKKKRGFIGWLKGLFDS